ncbi:hypothetical protein BDW02DRAFT_303531 [Decorospora gaudefroyi]|uniref:Uncharacterized protein n=1 Tax=Decorospora gaudefroyi TaxID=184978 RepID=A0A6A5KRR2_9PLEO|nr:hypothetical protein BDW02DRAFT_303531 [Decorospora gaudefroyi]
MPSRNRRPSAAMYISFWPNYDLSVPGVPVLARYQQRARQDRGHVWSLIPPALADAMTRACGVEAVSTVCKGGSLDVLPSGMYPLACTRAAWTATHSLLAAAFLAQSWNGLGVVSLVLRSTAAGFEAQDKRGTYGLRLRRSSGPSRRLQLSQRPTPRARMSARAQHKRRWLLFHCHGRIGGRER